MPHFFKQKIYTACLNILQQKISELTAAFNSATEAGNNETKSTAGDKHETARAMMQLEQEKLGKQLKEAQEQKEELEKIQIDQTPINVVRGSLVKTNHGYLFIGPGLGKIKVDGETVIVMSPQSPLGKKMIGLKENDSAEINATTYVIHEIT
jgi:hypothetical protein